MPPRLALRRAASVFLVALAVRLAHIGQMRQAPFFTVLLGDSQAYDAWAQQIARGDWLGEEVFYQAPLYPYLLGVLYAFVGRDLLVVRLVQAGLGASACVVLMLAGWRFLGPQAGLVAGLMLALYPPAIFFDGLIQKSVLDVWFVCLALWVASHLVPPVAGASTGVAGSVPARARSRTRPMRGTGGRARGGDASAAAGQWHDEADRRGVRSSRSGWWFALGVTLGLLALTRENALVLLPAVAGWLLARGAPSPTRRVVALAWLLAGTAAALLPVATRNLAVGGEFVLTTAQFGPNFYIGNNPQADGTYLSLRFGRGAPEYERQDATELAERALGRRLTPAEVSRYWRDRALAYIRSQPEAWLRLLGRKAALLWNATEVLDTESQASHAEWSAVLRGLGRFFHFGVLVPVAAFGLVALGPARRRLELPLLMLLAYAASVLLFYVFARYRFPLVPFLVLLAAGGASHAGRLLAARCWRPLAGGAAVALLAAVGSNWPLVSDDLNRAVTENNLGTALHALGRLREAEVHYRRALSIVPDYVPAASNLGTLLRAEGRLGEAIAQYRSVLALRPDYQAAHYNLANALVEQGDLAEAIGHFERALALDPAWVEARHNLAVALATAGRWAEAARAFREVLRLRPDSAEAHHGLGNVLETLGDRDGAIAHFREAIRLQPALFAAHYDLGRVLLARGALVEATAALRQAVALDPRSATARNNLGIALATAGDLDGAIAQFEAALRLDPRLSDAQQNLATARLAIRARERAAPPGRKR